MTGDRTGRVSSLWVYPVKSCAGYRAPEMLVRPGLGIDGDRMAALVDGEVTSEPVTWQPRRAFRHLAQDERTATVRVGSVRPRRATLARDGSPLVVDLVDGIAESDRQARAALDAWFPGEGVGVVRAAEPLWDWPDSEVSLINLATVRAVEQAIGVTLDPRRFRANVYLDGLPPFEEYDWMGRVIETNGVSLEVIRSTRRCRATSVEPASGRTDLNLPAALARTLGHSHMGVYARVVAGGSLVESAPVQVMSPPDPVRLRRGLQERREATESWPRIARVVEVVREASDVISLWIQDPYAVRPAAGQHMRVHVLAGDRPAWRCYTASAATADSFRITVREQGEVSRRLANLSSGDSLVVSGPFGGGSDQMDADGHLLVSAGVGITPTAAVLRAWAEDNPNVNASVLHVARDQTPALWKEVVDLAATRLPNVRCRLFVTRSAGKPHRRPEEADIASAIPTDVPIGRLAAQVCGPVDFVDLCTRAVVRAGMAPEQVVRHLFASPSGTNEISRIPTAIGPATVTFAGLDRSLLWSPEAGSLLDWAELHGIEIGSSCRSGACGTCALPLLAGDVTYLREPVVPPAGRTVLTCVAIPAGPITLGSAKARRPQRDRTT